MRHAIDENVTTRQADSPISDYSPNSHFPYAFVADDEFALKPYVLKLFQSSFSTTDFLKQGV